MTAFSPSLIEDISDGIINGNIFISNNLLNILNYLLNLLMMVKRLLAMALLAMDLVIAKFFF